VPAAKEADFGCDYLDRSSLNVVLVLVFTDLQAAFNINAILCGAEIYAEQLNLDT